MSIPLTRREVLKTVAAATSVAGLGGVATTGSTAAQATPGAIVIPDSGVQLPTDNVNFRWIDSGDLKSYFFRKFFDAYTAAHPNIAITYDALPWAEINNVVTLGVQGGEAHDVFALPQTVTAAQAVAEGWIAPLDDIVPNFAAWKERFPIGTFLDGVHVFDGKTYTYPVSSSKRYGTMLFFEPAKLSAVGYDPATTRLTWDTFRDAARKLTEAGKGEYFGLLFTGKEPPVFSDTVRNLARMAGRSASGNDIDWRTGEYVYASDEYLAALELLMAINADGSMFPGALSLGAYDGRARFPTGVAGMTLTGPWDIVNYQSNNPEFAFNITSQPIPNSGQAGPLTYEEVGGNLSYVYINSPLKAVAGDMCSYIGSVEGQVALMAATNGNLRAMLPEAAEQAKATLTFDPISEISLNLFDEQVKLGPMIGARNPDTSKVLLQAKPLSPNFGEIAQGIFSGQVSDPKAAMQDLQDRANAELDRAIKAAQDGGAQVSRDDWVFPNWDPTQDYTEAQYKELGS